MLCLISDHLSVLTVKIYFCLKIIILKYVQNLLKAKVIHFNYKRSHIWSKILIKYMQKCVLNNLIPKWVDMLLIQSELVQYVFMQIIWIYIL